MRPPLLDAARMKGELRWGSVTPGSPDQTATRVDIGKFAPGSSVFSFSPANNLHPSGPEFKAQLKFQLR